MTRHLAVGIICGHGIGRRKNHHRRSRHLADHALLHNTRADRTRDLVDGARDNLDSLILTDDLATTTDLGEFLDFDANVVQHLAPPCVLMDIVIDGGGLQRLLGHKPASQLVKQIILQQKDLFDLPEGIRLILLHPQKLCRGPRRGNFRLTCDLVHALLTEFRAKLVRLARRAVVQPYDRFAKRYSCLVGHDQCLALRINAERIYLMLGGNLVQHLLDQLPIVIRGKFNDIPRYLKRIILCNRFYTNGVLVKHRRLQGRRPHVNAQ